jgi:hypothetical protein
MVMSLSVSHCSAQEKQSGTPTIQKSSPWDEELKKYPGLSEELVTLVGKFVQDVHFPPPRNESRLLPFLPPDAVGYGATPNYGDAVSQALAIFRQELKESAVLRDWWQHGSLAKDGPRIEDAIDKTSQLYQFLGPELAVSATNNGKEPTFLAIAEVRKPGLRAFLLQWNEQLAAESKVKSKSGLRILDPEQLATAKPSSSSDELLIVVRNDYVLASSDLAALRAINDRLASATRDFTSTPFAQRILTEYHEGLTTIVAADIHGILARTYPPEKQSATFKQSGFADTQYLLWDHKAVSGHDVSQMELSFTSPRHAAAAWLAPPSPLGSLDFVSPKAMLAASLVLTNPSQIFDDLKSFSPDPKTFAAISGGEQALGLSLKDDLLNLLTGELTFEFDSITQMKPVWRAFVAVKDPAHLQKTLTTLSVLTQSHLEPAEKGDLTFYSVEIPNGNQPANHISYAFSDGYMIVGPSVDSVADSIQLHRSGASLAKSKKFLDSIPPGYSNSASALFYEDSSALTSLRLGSFFPGLSESVQQPDAPPLAMHIYGEKSAIREISSNSAFDAAGILIVAAIAIPNLLRSRRAANEASAVGTVRTLNTAQVTYDASYPQKGFAHNIMTMGQDPKSPTAYVPEHAGLLDPSLAGSACTADGWCTKAGYRFRSDAHRCKNSVCGDYVNLASPISESTGTRSFCSTSTGIIHFYLGAPFTAPVSVAECNAWLVLK